MLKYGKMAKDEIIKVMKVKIKTMTVMISVVKLA